MTFAGRFVIKDNFAKDDADNKLKQANIEVKPSFTFDLDGETADAHNFYAYFNTDELNTEMPLITWTGNGDTWFEEPSIEHIYNDNKAPVNNSVPFSKDGTTVIKTIENADITATDQNYPVVYKGNDEQLYIGSLAKFANPIYAVGNYKLLTGEKSFKNASN